MEARHAWLAGFFISAGALHFAVPGAYERIVPPYLPRPRALVLLSGALEIVLGAAVLVPALRRSAGWGLAALLCAVFPANWHMAAEALAAGRSPRAVLLVLRLPLQAVFIAWALWASAGCAAAPARAGGFTRHADVPYARREEGPLLADVFVPEGEGPFPAVLVVHGGGWFKGKRSHTESIARRLAARGYVAVNATYRFAPTRVFPAQVHDVKEAVAWMRESAARYRIDPARIGGFGYSAGAHLVAMLAFTDPSHGLEGPAAGKDTGLRAAVLGGAPENLSRFPRSPMVRDFLGKSFAEDPALFAKASPLSYVSAGDPPVFLYHGTFDRLVPIAQARELEAALGAAKVPVEHRWVRGLGHVAAFFFDGTSVDLALDFLDRALR